jgi:hypothetical protein
MVEVGRQTKPMKDSPKRKLLCGERVDSLNKKRIARRLV